MPEVSLGLGQTRLPHAYQFPLNKHNLPGLSNARLTTGGNNVTVADEEIYFTPIQLRAGTVLDQISVQFSATTSDKILIGLYQQDVANGRPGKLVADLGSVTETFGIVEVSIDYTVPHTDLYWIAAMGEGTPAMFANNGGGLFVGMFSTEQMAGGYKSTDGGSSGLPADAPTTNLTITNVHAISVLFRVKSTPPVVSSEDDLPGKMYPEVGEYIGEGLHYNTVSNQTITLADNELYLRPFQCPLQQQLFSLLIEVTTSGSNSADLVLYDSNLNNLPNKLVASASVSVASTGSKNALVKALLPPGLYWAGVYNSSGGNFDTHALNCDAQSQFSFVDTTGAYPQAGFKWTSNPTSLPDPAGVVVGDLTGTEQAPAIDIQMSGDNLSYKKHEDLITRWMGQWATLPIPGAYIGPCIVPVFAESQKEGAILNQVGTPFLIGQRVQIDGVALKFNAAGDNATYQMALYSGNRFSMGPDRLLAKTATFIPSGSPAPDIALSIGPIWLDPGTYWVLMANDQSVSTDKVLSGNIPVGNFIQLNSNFGQFEPHSLFSGFPTFTFTDNFGLTNPTARLMAAIRMKVKTYG